MLAHKQILWQTLLKVVLASVILALLLPYSAPTRVQAQSSEPPPFDPTRLVFETVAGDYGNIYNVIQDKDGFLWLAGINGAIQYDGYEAETIYSGETVSALFEDSEGLIWMVVRSGVAVYDKKTGKITKYVPNPNDPHALSGETLVLFQKTQLLAEDRDGSIWIATLNGLNKFDKKSGNFTAYKSKAGGAETLLDNNVWSVLTAKDGSLWVGTATGLHRFDPRTGQEFEAHAGYIDSKGRPETGETKIFTERDGISPGMACGEAPVTLPDGQIWMAGTGGIIFGLNIVQRSGEHLLTLITDILDLSRIETGRMELYSVEVHFSTFLDNIVGIIRARAAAKGLTFSFDTPPIFPEGGLPVGMQVDETRLRQVLLNLLDNAVKFTEAGQVILRVSCSEFRVSSEEAGTRNSKPETLLRFEVEDTGLGISPDQLERIFQPFEQIGDVLHYTKGTGLGLAVSRQLVGLMGGELHMESPPFTSPPLASGSAGRTEGGPGSLFWFEVALPVLEMATEPRLAEPSEWIISGYKGPRCRVLVVDDVPSNRGVVDLLEPPGFEVIEAVDGQQALFLAQELRPDLILMDRWMPVLDGFEAARQIRQNPELAGLVVIAVSASVSKEDQAQSREVGINAFLPKPVHWPNLAALLEEHLQLEWEYQEQGSQGAGEPGREFSSAPAPLVPPPEEMAVLYDLALRGDMRGIRERAAHIETLGEQYVPFARKLRELAKGFEERELLALVVQSGFIGDKVDE